MGNNPINYVDPDGRIQRNQLEYKFIMEVLGDNGVSIFDSTSYLCLPQMGGTRSASWDIMGGVIFLSSDIFFNPMSSSYGRNTFIHELFHQLQYAQDSKAFGKLIDELELNTRISKYGLNPTVECKTTNSILGTSIKLIPDYSTRQDNYTYNYGNLASIMKLTDLSFLESQAQLVGDFADYYYNERYSCGVDYQWQKMDMKKMAEILKESGYDTEAVKWVLENY